MNLRAGLLVWLILTCASCGSHAKDTPVTAQAPLISVDDFFENNAAYSGQAVRVRGFLFTGVTRTWFLHRTREEGSQPNTPLILVIPDEAKQMPDSAFAKMLLCGENYVELSGYAGQLPQKSGIGIIQIKRIVVFESFNFGGDGKICFDSSEL